MKTNIIRTGARHLKRALLLRLAALLVIGFGAPVQKSIAQDCGTSTRTIPARTDVVHHNAVIVHHDAVIVHHDDVYEYVPPVVVHHDAVVVHHPAVTHVEYDDNGEPFLVEDSPAWDEEISPAWDEEVSPGGMVLVRSAYDEVVREAYDEVVREAYDEVIVLEDARTISVPSACTWTVTRSEASPWSPASNTVPAGSPFLQSRTVVGYAATWSRGEAGPNGEAAPEVFEGENIVSNETETQQATGTGTPAEVIWTDFDEFVEWAGTGGIPSEESWTPSRSSVPDGELFVQTATVQIAYYRKGQRDPAGNERNVVGYWATEVQSRPNTGTGPAGPNSVKTAQTINFPQPPNMLITAGDNGVELTATASSNLPVSFTVASGPATTSGGRLYFTGHGGVTVRASQAGNATYAPAPDVERTIQVSLPEISPTAATQSTERSIWKDVNGDGILDEIIMPGTSRFTYSAEYIPQPPYFSVFPSVNFFWEPIRWSHSFTPDVGTGSDRQYPEAFWFAWDPSPEIYIQEPHFNMTYEFEAESGWDYVVYSVEASQMNSVGSWGGTDPNHGTITTNGDRRIWRQPNIHWEFLDGRVFILVRLGKAPIVPNWTREGIAADPQPIRYYMADRPRFLSLVPAWNWDLAISRGDWDVDQIVDPSAVFEWVLATEVHGLATPQLPPVPPTLPDPTTPPPHPKKPIETAGRPNAQGAAAALLILLDIVQRIPFAYVNYEKPSLTHPGCWYVGRAGPRIGNARAVLAMRELEHARPGGKSQNHGPALLRSYIETRGLVTRAYYAVRGREQQMIDNRGGFVPNVGATEAYKLGLTNCTNERREIATYDFEGYIYWRTSNFMFGELHAYTGDEWTKFFDFVVPLWPTGGQILKVAPPAPL